MYASISSFVFLRYQGIGNGLLKDLLVLMEVNYPTFLDNGRLIERVAREKDRKKETYPKEKISKDKK